MADTDMATAPAPTIKLRLSKIDSSLLIAIDIPSNLIMPSSNEELQFRSLCLRETEGVGMKSTALIVHDDLRFGHELATQLARQPYDVVVVSSAKEGLAYLRAHSVAVLVCDDRPQGMSGIALLGIAKEVAPDCLRVLLTTNSASAIAVHAINTLELFRFLFKPCTVREIDFTILDAMKARREHRQFIEAPAASRDENLDQTLNAEIDRALESCHMIYQPVLSLGRGPGRSPDDVGERATFGYEALLRSDHETLSNPVRLIDAVTQAGREYDLDRRVRDLVATDMAQARSTLDPDATVFVNLLTTSLEDPRLLQGNEPLRRFASRVVLEVSEHTPLAVVDELESSLRALRAQGYRIGLDDLAGGPTGLQVFGALTPAVVRFDISLIRGIYQSRARSRTIVSMIELCQRMGCLTLAEKIESKKEFDYLVELGVELFQGYYIGRPSAGFTPVTATVDNQSSYGTSR